MVSTALVAANKVCVLCGCVLMCGCVCRCVSECVDVRVGVSMYIMVCVMHRCMFTM